jgi:hypothetical protein
LHRNCLIKPVVEGKIKGRRGRRHRQLLDDQKGKEEKTRKEK